MKRTSHSLFAEDGKFQAPFYNNLFFIQMAVIKNLDFKIQSWRRWAQRFHIWRQWVDLWRWRMKIQTRLKCSARTKGLISNQKSLTQLLNSRKLRKTETCFLPSLELERTICRAGETWASKTKKILMKKAKMWLLVSSKGCIELAYKIMTVSKRGSLPCTDSKWSTRSKSS